MPHAPPAVSLPRLHLFKKFCGLDTKDVKNPHGRENIIEISHIVCLATHCHQVERRRDMSSEETYTTPRRFCLGKIDAMRVLIMDQGQEFGAEFCATTVVFFRLFVIWKLLGKTWQQSAMEHGSRSRLRKRGYETPRAEAEVNEFVDFTLAGLNRRVGRAGFKPRQSLGGGRDCHTVCCKVIIWISEWFHEIQRDNWRRIEALHMSSEGGCTAAADLRAVSTATNSRLRNSVY